LIVKNIQVIDGARNCTYAIFAANDEDFALIFPGAGQDVEFVEDFIGRVGKDLADTVCERLWQVRVDKKAVQGIDGTLFYGLEYKKSYYPSKRESEMIVSLEK